MTYTTEGIRLLELDQLQAAEGPCLDCFRTGAAVSVPDLAAAAGRWPRFAARAAEEGLHAVPMRLRAETIGALNLFNSGPGSMPDSDLAVCQALADVATIGILQERAITRAEVLTEQLQTALNSRVVIEQAKGLLAERTGLGLEEAFALLRGHARRNGLRLSDIARAVVTGALVLEVPVPKDG